MQCSNCEEEAIIRVGWKGKNYCVNHYKRYFLAQVSKVLHKYDIRGKVAVALSGGKDSATCVESLTHFDRVDVEAFHINLGIEDFSEESLQKSREICKKQNVDLHEIDLEEKYGRNISEITKEESGKACGTCGTVKRYLMNRFAHENGFDYVATGHNLSDEISSTFNNLANVYLTPFRGLEPVLEEKEKYNMVSRIKPLYWVKDSECQVYADTNDIEYFQKECPLSKGSPTNELKKWLHDLDEKRPKSLRNFAKSFNRIEDRMETSDDELKTCDKCGYPTATEVCRFCRIMKN